MKWVYVQIKGWPGSAAVMVPQGLTVSEFKLLLGLHPQSNVMTAAFFLPLAGTVRLFDLFDDFDTVYIEA